MPNMKKMIPLLGALFIMMTGAPVAAAQDITVSAAASLKSTFTKMAQQFEAANPNIKIRFNFAGSSQLAAQIEQGAPVDVFASADRRTLDDLSTKGFIGPNSVLAHNKLTAIFFKGKSTVAPPLDHLARPGVKLVLPAAKLPAAFYVTEFLTKADAAGLANRQFRARVRQNTVSEEPDIRMVATKISMGAADGAIVYATDVTPEVREKVFEVPIPQELNVRAEYMIGMVKSSAKKEAAKRFYDYVLSSKGQAVLVEAGFMLAH
jgi:molybdate transport system substrate-binding protein